MKLNTILLLALCSCPAVATERYSGANHIQFQHSEKPFVGSGFLLQHGQQVYAVTAKHVLFETMDQGIDHINIDGQVTQWQLKPFNEDTGVVTLGKLLNANPAEALDMAVLADDWLLFAVKENHSRLQPLRLADEAPQAGDELVTHGCTYQSQATCHQDRFKGHFVRMEGDNLLLKLNDAEPGTLRGLSGAPVLNAAGEVVGIVSNVLPDPDGGHYFAPFGTGPLKSFLLDESTK
ncbi:S1 family peptidase [Marinicella meishanensis]|uniref:S1 family peptidase n=1 Tax=Marinicella meishanensis TaxID=2873263 RepID=UPI001CBBD0BB|nr:serine protease [Marinicella sp. NBU2979]